MKQLIIFIILFCCVNYVWHEHKKTLVIPGNPVIYKGKMHEIAEMEINTVTNLKTVKLDSLNSKGLPVDSVKMVTGLFGKSYLLQIVKKRM